MIFRIEHDRAALLTLPKSIPRLLPDRIFGYDKRLHMSLTSRACWLISRRNFNTGTRGFAAPEDSTTAVCILPGTELGFSAEVRSRLSGWQTRTISSRTAIFRQINKDVPQVH